MTRLARRRRNATRGGLACVALFPNALFGVWPLFGIHPCAGILSGLLAAALLVIAVECSRARRRFDALAFPYVLPRL
jgi:hypothetical protein